jgi:type VI secretion system protein ImpA
MSLREALLQPIPGSNRVGEYLRYDPIYDRIKEARKEDLDLPQHGGMPQSIKKADWVQVVKLTTDALAKQSKDLQIAAWLTEGLARRDGFGGLRDGLDLVIGLIEEYWDDLYPELEDGDAELRAVPLQWLAQVLEEPVRKTAITGEGHTLLEYGLSLQVPTELEASSDKAKKEQRQQAVAEGKPTPEEFEAGFAATPKAWYKRLVADLDESQSGLERLERLADERFGSDAPNFIKLRDVLQQVRQLGAQLLARKLETDPDPPEEVPVTESAAESAAIEVGGIVGPASSAGSPPSALRAPGAAAAVASLDDASARVAAAARFLRAQSPHDPAPYLLLRGYRWGELRRTPGEVDPHLLEAPPTELRSRLKGFSLDGQWNEVLEAGEEIMAAPYGRGWLDLQRFAVAACDALGGEFDVLGAALRGALRTLLHDVPQLPSLTLLDDSPTANPDTLRWLRAEGLMSAAARVEEPTQPAVDGTATAGRDPFPRALALAQKGQTQRAVELLVREAAREQSERGRFLRRAQAASLMVEAGMAPVALPILNDLLVQIDTHQLEKWEAGETIALPLDLLFRCNAQLSPDDAAQQSLYLRICRLDPLRAIRLRASGTNGDAGV